MTLFAELNDIPESLDDPDLKYTPEKQAEGIAQRWNNFVNGSESTFEAYFMLDNPIHEPLRRLFTAYVEIPSELPSEIRPNRKLIKMVGNTSLFAFSHAHDDGTPYDVTYFGEKIDPVQ